MNRYLCAPSGDELVTDVTGGTPIFLFRGGERGQAHAGRSLYDKIRRRRLDPPERAWDFLSIALSIVTADHATLRSESPDGWTRTVELDIAVIDPTFWTSQAEHLARLLAFLTTDRWTLRFHAGGFNPPRPLRRRRRELAGENVVLLSGGLDSLVGAIDLASTGQYHAVSKTATGDGEKQVGFARAIGMPHLQLNPVCKGEGTAEQSQRSRSMSFIALGVLAATSTSAWQAGADVTLNICENGYIALNPPLTGSRLGSLSTRTAHPEYLFRLQSVLSDAGLRVRLANPYAHQTKGEMLENCGDQNLLEQHASFSTSCGRFQRFQYRHCGRCVPCQVRRAAFLRWGRPDRTVYVHTNLGLADPAHAQFDDVRSVAAAIEQVKLEGLQRWLGSALAARGEESRDALSGVIERGLAELENLHDQYGVA